MVEGAKRGVTRGYVLGLLGATLVVAAAIVVASWGLLAMALGREPIETAAVPLWFGVLSIGLGLAMLGVLLWRQAISLLRGRKSPVAGIVLGAAFGVYLIWGLCGVLAGLTIDDTWFSPFALILMPVWGIAVVLFWAVLARRIYTDRPTPKWPWERREERE
ncbi:hypothetical protein SD72_12105 [Leucobacter komagatae]|uniref:Uncharacterized protein n=1 Tax=Leucobacter komagatae TaxID=55969 RepID=A0A0D0IK30_9MICO|nr:hypothetical protein SD72_12105 [Leucobacter komagatae]